MPAGSRLAGVFRAAYVIVAVCIIRALRPIRIRDIFGSIIRSIAASSTAGREEQKENHEKQKQLF